MKFTDGFWQIRENITAAYAHEYMDHHVNGKELTVYTVSKHVASKADTMDVMMLTLSITSPMENVIRVSMVHFDGGCEREPFVALTQTDPYVTITEDEPSITYRSGETRAVISKAPSAWKIEFYHGDRLLTDTSYKNMAYMKDTAAKKNYMVEQLAIDIRQYL